jgi:hypothetical protein
MARVIAYSPPGSAGAALRHLEERRRRGSYEFLREGARLLDACTQFHYLARRYMGFLAQPMLGLCVCVRIDLDCAGRAGLANEEYRHAH